MHHVNTKVGWLVGFWCTHFRDLAPLINSVLELVSSAKVKALLIGVQEAFLTLVTPKGPTI